MGRTTGSKNVNSPALIKNLGGDSEDMALAEFHSGLVRWKARAAEKKQEGKTGVYETDVAEAYRVLLNKFSQPEEKPEDNE